ncbi:MAG: class I SAM-dependent methyltransferase [Coriobacteriia bacterium]|nr:class I SAM-dependent methyltransferase [Coriobacteriia bacterium]
MSSSELECRSCGCGGLRPIVSLGETPLANSLLAEADLDRDEPRYPLDLVFCPHCSLVQITLSVPPQQLFGEYLYFSSFSDTMLRSAKELTNRLTLDRAFGAESLAVEIASNDGYLLQYYLEGGIPVLGIEPAANIAEVAESERGIPTLVEFFTSELAQSLVAEGTRADVIHANNVMAHVPDLNGFVEGIATLLKPDGVAVIEAPYVCEMVDKAEFDTIYHEHLCYFSLTALNDLFTRHGLTISDVELIPIHGGSLRIFANPAAGPDGKAAVQSPDVTSMLAAEHEWGIRDFAPYERFAEKVVSLRAGLTKLLAKLKDDGARIAAYGASAKGSTLLNYCGIGAETLDYVVDRSTVKQGYFTPGTHLLILAPEKLLDDQPDYVLLLTWNFAEEIMGQQAEYIARGGRFILPVPEPRVV